ncbi:hypothetical protein ACFL5O_02505 [Myxococcota bacterium]
MLCPRILLLVTLVLAWFPTAALAAPKRVQVVAIMSDDAFQHAQALSGALRRAIRGTDGFELAPGDFALEVLAAAFNCSMPPEASCLEKIAKKIEAPRFVWGTLKKTSDREVSARLSYWEDGHNQRDTTMTYSSNLNDPHDDTLYELAEGAIGKLLGPPEGQLTVRAARFDGSVFVNDVPRGRLVQGRAVVLVPAGPVRVRVSIEGYRDALATAEVPAGGGAEVDIEPILKSRPQRVDPIRNGGTQTRQVRSTGVGSYVVLGAGAAIAAAGSVFWGISYSQQQDEDYRQYQERTPRGTDPCTRAVRENRQDIAGLCNRNETTQIVAWVLTPLGLALAGTGVLLTVTGSSSDQGGQFPESRFMPLVAAGPTGGSVDLRISF